jgi:hypothetical protein
VRLAPYFKEFVMIALSYSKAGITSTYFIKDSEIHAAQRGLQQLQLAHGKDNCFIDYVDDYPLPQDVFWNSRWSSR